MATKGEPELTSMGSVLDGPGDADVRPGASDSVVPEGMAERVAGTDIEVVADELREGVVVAAHPTRRTGANSKATWHFIPGA